MNNLLKIGIITGVSTLIYYCCIKPDKKKVKFNDKPEIIKNDIQPIVPITYNVLDHYRILDSVYNIKLTKLDLKQEPQIIDYYKLKSPIKDDKWEIIS